MFLYNKSICGFNSLFTVICEDTSYPFGFPVKMKRPPLEVLKLIILILQQLKLSITYIRVDEDGSLSKSTECCSLISTLDLVLETTGGY